MSTNQAQAGQSSSGPDARQTLIAVWQREIATTQRVLRAYPEDQSELRPHERARNARELAWMFTLEMNLATAAVNGTLDLGKRFTPVPARLGDVIEQFDRTSVALIDAIRTADLSGTVQFFVAPETMGDYTKPDFLWFLLHDHIHHRGQFSVYLRMSGGRVPSIYGPSADEPWY